MKKLSFVIFVLFMSGITHLYSQYNVSGILSYDNNSSTPMKNCIVYLVNNGDTLDQDTTSATGSYSFSNVLPGNYTLKVKSTSMYGGVASSDALAILRHFVGIPPLLTGLKLIASDLDSSGYTNSTDGLLVSQRFVHQINSFPSGDWAFEVPTIVVTDANVTQNIKALCFGDVNGSFIPYFP